MRFILGLVLIASMVGMVAQRAGAVEPLYKVTPIFTEEDVKACVAAHGRGAFVFGIDAEGGMTSDPAPHCIVAAQ